MKLLKKLKHTYEKTKFPDELTNILLEVYSPTSLIVSFDDPVETDDAFIIKYMSTLIAFLAIFLVICVAVIFIFLKSNGARIPTLSQSTDKL